MLELSVEEAREFFGSLPKIKRPLQALCDTGLGYLKLGQTSPTLSGGEAQRVKLVSHLLRDSGSRTAWAPSCGGTCSSWKSRPSGCTWPTCNAWWTCCSGSWTAAIR